MEKPNYISAVAANPDLLPSPTPPSLLLKAVSLFLSCFILLSPIPLALASPPPSPSIPIAEAISENVENANGILTLATGRTSGVFVSEVLDFGEPALVTLLHWAARDPSLTVSFRTEGMVPPRLPDEPENPGLENATMGENASESEVGVNVESGSAENVGQLDSELVEGAGVESELVENVSQPEKDNSAAEGGTVDGPTTVRMLEVDPSFGSYVLSVGGEGRLYLWGNGWVGFGEVNGERRLEFGQRELSSYLLGSDLYVKVEGRLDSCSIEARREVRSGHRIFVRLGEENLGEWMGPFVRGPVPLNVVARYLQYRVELWSEDERLAGPEGPSVSELRFSTRPLVEVGLRQRIRRGVAEFGRSSPLRRVTLVGEGLEGREISVRVLPRLPENVPDPGYKGILCLEISLEVPVLSASLQFALPKQLLQETGSRKERVVLMHYKQGWEALPTRILGEDENEVRFFAETPGFSIFYFIDNENADFALGTHENTENVDGYVRLIQNYTLGRFTSRVFDAGGIAEWDNLVWSFTEPQGGATDIDYVGAEPDTLKDGSGRVGTQWQGTYENTRNPDDGSYENLSETGAAGSVTYTVMQSPENETVVAGGTIDTENAMEVADTTEAGGSNYENIYENSYSATAYTYAQYYENRRGRVENFPYQQQEAGGYAVYHEHGITIENQQKAIAVYSSGTELPSVKEWTGSEWISLPSPQPVSGPVEWIVVKSARTRNELILGTLDSTGDIAVQVWNGVTQSWGAQLFLSNVGTTIDGYRCFDIEYENGNDRAIVVYNLDNNTDNLYYVIWDGNSWSDPLPIDLPTTGIPYVVELASNPLPDNNDLLLIYWDSNANIFGFHWNGSAWDNMGATAIWSNTAVSPTVGVGIKPIDVAYEATTGEAMFIWGTNSNSLENYRIWNGSTLSAVSTLTITGLASTTRFVQLVADPYSDNLLLGAMDGGLDYDTAFWDGDAWGNIIEHGAGAEAATDQSFGMAFETLPGHQGHAWTVYGEANVLYRRHWNGTSWGAATSSGDDTARVHLVSHWFTGHILGVVMSDDGAGGSYDGIYPIWTTDGGSTWNNLTAATRWVAAELPGNPIFERAGISCRRHWPTLYGLEIYENIDNIPLAENYYLEIYYKLSNTFDKFHVYVENAQSPGTWVYAGDLYKDVWTTFSFQLTPDLMFGGENVHIKIVDNDNTKESFTNVYVDYVRVRGVKPGYNLEVIHTLMAPTGKASYTLEVAYYLTGDNENIEVYLWDFDVGEWDYVGLLDSKTPAQWTYELTGTPYILGTGKVRVRYVQTDIPTQFDTVSTSFMLNYTRVRSTTAAGQSLNWQYTITGVTTGYENYDLKIRGYTYNDLEYIWIDVWNVASGWQSTEYYMPRNAPSTITFRLSPLENYLDGDNIYIRFRDDSPSDTTTTFLILDMVRIEEAFWATSDVKLQVRVSGDNLNWTEWMGPDGSSGTYFEPAFTSMENIPDNRYIQYRIYFSSQHLILSGANGPKVDWVRINASSLPNLIYPINVNVSNPQPTFQWETVAADNYHLQIATDPGFTNLVVDNENILGTENTWTPPNPLPDNHYWWRIRRYYNNSYYAWCGPENFRIDTLAPGPPELVSPTDGEVMNDNTPLLDWNPPPENSLPLLYQVWIAYDSAFANSVPGYPTDWISTDSYEVPSPGLPDSTYYWKVRAMDNAGNIADWPTTCRSFRIDTTPPAVPTPVSPAPGSWVAACPNLDWNAVTTDNRGATELSTPVSYMVYVSRDPAFATGVYTSGWITEDNWIATPCYENNTVWYWKVCAKDNAGTGNVSENSVARSFRVDNECPQVQLYWPADNQTLTDQLTVTLQWYTTIDGGSGLANYHLQIDNDNDFSSPLVDNLSIPASENSYTYTFPDIGTYYWRVRAVDAVGNWGAWSENRSLCLRKWFELESWSCGSWSVTGVWNLLESWSATLTTQAVWYLLESWTNENVSAPVPAPVLSSPPNWDNENITVWTFMWENLQPADSYVVQIDNDLNGIPDFSTYIESPSLVGKSWSTTITQDGLYFWRVRMVRTGASSPWSENWAFRRDTLPPASPQLLSPVNGENTNDNTPLLSWVSVTENSLPVLYYVSLSDDESFSHENRSCWTAENQWEVSPVLPEGIWYWRVRALDNAGNWGAWSVTRTFRVDVTPPAPPASPIYPPNNGWTTGSPNLRWPAVQENSLPVMYWAEYSIYSDFPPAATTSSGWIYDENWQLSGLSELYVYYWRVKARDNAGNVGSFSPTWQFKVDLTPPSQVQLYKPDNNACLSDNLTVTFTWYNATDDPNNTGWYSGLENYVLQIDEEPDFASPLQVVVPASENSTTYSLPAYGRYWWRVKAVDAVGNEGGWSNPFVLYVGIWRLLEQWFASTSTSAGWFYGESWSATVWTVASWTGVDSWSCVQTASASWRPMEGWGGAVGTILSGWLAIEGLLGAIAAPALWRKEEEWTETLNAPAFWLLEEQWSAGTSAPALWRGLEAFSGTVCAPVHWRVLEGWTATVPAPALWQQLDSWTGGVGSVPTLWCQLDSWNVTVNAPVPAPILLAPPNGINTPDSTPNFSWENLQPADTYDLQVDNDNDWSTVNYQYTGLVSTSYEPFAPYPDGLYYWRVRQTRTGATGPWSEIWTLRIDTTAPASPVLVSPRDGENLNDTTPLLDWEPVTTQVNGTPENALPVTYEVQVATDSGFSNVVWSDNRFTADNREVPVTLPDNLYYWRVRAWDNAGNVGSWSVRSFRVDTLPPAAPTLVWPTGGVWTNGAPNLDWTPVPENSLPIRYHIQIRLAAGGYASPVRDAWTENIDNWIVTPEITTEEVYYWHVQAVDNAGNVGPWSAEDSFKVDRTPPNQVQLYRPENNSCAATLLLTFSWYTGSDPSPGSGIGGYHLQVSTSPDFSVLVYENENIPSSENSLAVMLPAYDLYYWRVRAVDAVGWVGPWSGTFNVYVGRWLALEGWAVGTGSVPPSWHLAESWSSTVVAPSSWSWVESWDAGVSSVPTYWYLEEEWSAFTATPAYWQSVEEWGASVRFPADWWSVDAWSGFVNAPTYWNVLEGWSPQVSAPVPPPVLLSPPDKSGQTDVVVNFSWDNVLPADYYNLQIDDENTFAVPLLLDTNTSSESYTYELPGTGTYYWRVRQYRDSDGPGPLPGAWSEWSAIWSVSVDITPPLPPLLVSPRNNENLNDNTPLLDWEPVEENSYPVAYHVLVYDAVTLDQVRYATLYDYGTGENTQWEIFPSLPDGRYFWKVYAVDNAGNSSDASAIWYFRVDTLPPVAPILSSPPDNYKENQTEVQLSWNDVVENSKPVLYYVSVSDTPSFSYENQASGWIEGTSWTITFTEGAWYWRVKAKDNAGNEGPWSDNWRLVIDLTPPAAPVLAAPSDNFKTNDNTVSFQWQAVENEVDGSAEDSPPLTYRVSISDEPSFEHENYTSGWLGENSWESYPIPDGVWYWRVCARDNAGNIGPWSENRKITIDTSRPTTPVPVSPHDFENLNNVAPTLRWENSFDLTAVVYKVWVAKDNQFINVVRESDWISENFWTIDVSLPDNLYYWKVCARDEFYNYSDNSAVFRFRVDTIAPAAPTPSWPVGIKINDNSPNFCWQAPPENSYPLEYRVQLKNILHLVLWTSDWVTDENCQYPGEKPDDEYYWCVQAKDNAGNIGDFCSDIWFRIDTKRPSPPVLLSPIQGENLNDNTPSFAWEEVTTDETGGAEMSPPLLYRIWVARDSSFLSIVADSDWFGGTSWTAPELGDDVYYWRVCAKDNAGNIGENSVTRWFRVDTLPPENVFLIWPDNGLNVLAQPNLDWNPAVDNSLPVRYRVLINRMGVLENYRDSGWILPDNWIVSPPLPDNDYEWRVLAMDNAGNVFETPTRWFRVETQPPAPPTLYTPSNGENTRDNTPLLSWENVWDVSQPVMFHAWVATDNQFTNVVRESGWIYENWWEVPSLADGLYYWRVCARDNVGNISENSETWRFRVDTLAPPAPQPVLPENMGTTSNNVAFGWAQVEDNSGVIYHLQIFTYPDDAHLVHENDNLWENSYVYALSEDVYIWRVRARDTAGNVGEWSGFFVFAVEKWVRLASPVDGFETNDNTPTFQWVSRLMAENYEIWVDNDPDFSSPEVRENTTENSFTVPLPGLGDENYYWKVRMYVWGAPSPFSDVRSLLIDTVAPSTTLIQPADGTRTRENQVTFRWSSVEDLSYSPTGENSGVKFYELWVDNDSNFSSPFHQENLTGVEKTIQLPDENWFWKVRVWDEAGNCADSAVRSLLIDTLPPGIPAASPQHLMKTNDNTPMLSWSSVSDYSGSPTGEVAGVWRYELWVDNDVDFGSTVLKENLSENSYTFASQLGDENYYFKIRVWDQVGNVSNWSSTWWFEVDTMPPSIPLKVGPSDGFITTNLSVTLNWSPSYDNSYSPTGENAGVAHYELIVDDDGFVPPYSHHDNAITGTVKIISLSPGIYQWIVRAWDWAGNVSENQAPWTFIIDIAGPSVPNLLLPENGSATNKTLIYFDWTDSTDDYSGVDYYQIQVDNDPDFLTPAIQQSTSSSYISLSVTSDELWYWRVRAVDRAGNPSEWSAPFQFVRDTVPPSTPAKSSPSNGYITENTTITFTWSLATDSSGSPTVEPSGVWCYELWVDNDTDFSSPENLENISHPENSRTHTFADENYLWRVRAWDRAGNAGSFEAPWWFIVDTTPPEAPVPLSPPDNSSTNDNTPILRWSIPYDLAGVNLYELWIDNDPSFASPEYTDNTITDNQHEVTIQLPDENYHWKVRARDVLGHWGGWSQVFSLMIDTRAPGSPASSPENGYITKQVNPTIRWASVVDYSYSSTGEVSGVRWYEMQIDNDSDFTSLFLVQFSPDNWFQPGVDENYPPLGFPDARWYYRVRAWDWAGNASAWSPTWWFIVDTSPPPAPVPQTPENGKMINVSDVVFTWTVPEDLSGISEYTLFLDNDADFSSYTSFPGILINYLQVSLGDERYYWKVRATDRAGNVGENSVVFTFLLDTVSPPTTVLGTPADGLRTKENTQLFSWSYVIDLSNSPTGEVAGVVAYELWIDNDSNFSSPFHQENLTENSKMLELPDENWFWRVRVWDNAGNYSTSAVRSLLVDTRPPDVPTLQSPADGTKTNDNRPLFTWSSVVDRSWSPTLENSGVKCYELWIDNDTDFGSPVLVENLTSTSRQVELPDENYFWRVRVWDWAGNVSEFSSTFSILIDTVKPSIPFKITVADDTGVDDPDNQVVTNDNTPTFYWYPSVDSSNSPTGENAGVRWYEIVIENVFTGYRISENVAGTSYNTTLTEGQWRWWVRAWDWAGNVGDFENYWIVVVDLTPPVPPTLLSPSDGHKTNDPSGKIVFDWADASDEWGIPSTDAYQIEVDNSTAFDHASSYYTSAIVSASTRTFFFFAGGVPLDETRYWHVRVRDNAGNWSSWSVVWSVLLDTLPPDVPSKAQPADNSILNSPNVEFGWSDVVDHSRSPSGDVAGVRCYELWISTDNTFSTWVIRENLTSTSYSTSLTDNRYYWRVRAWDWAGNASGFESYWSFIVDNNPPPAPTLLSPGNGTITNDNTPMFEWTSVFDITGVRYELWVDNDSDFSSPEILENLTTTSRIPLFELPDENYHWRVRAWDGVIGGVSKAGPFSQVWTLLIDTVPPFLPENSPNHGMIYGTSMVDLTWNPVLDRSGSPTGEVSGVAYYEIQVDNDPTFLSVNYSGTSTDNIWSLGDPGYPAGGFAEDNYYFRVRAWDLAGNAPSFESCVVWNFVCDVTRPYGPALYTPENDAAENNVVGDYVVVVHVWENVWDASGIDHYEIQVATDPDFTSPLPPEYFSPPKPENLTESTVTVFYPWDGRYYWRVRGYDRAAPTTPGSWSQVYTLVVDRLKPLTPTLSVPENHKITSDNTPLFGWENVLDNTAYTENVSGVDHYTLQIDNTPAFSSPTTFDNIRENFFPLPAENSLPVGTYYWRVRAVDRAGNQGDWSDWFTLRVLDLTISVELSDNVVNPNESFTISGRVSWQPDDIPQQNLSVRVYFDTNWVRTAFTESDGTYSTSFASGSLGWHTVRVEVTDSEGVTEENVALVAIRRLEVTLSLDDSVVNINQEITASGTVTLKPESLPENATLTFYLDGKQIGNGVCENGSYSWSYRLNFSPENVGSHSLQVVAVNADGITGSSQVNFLVKTITISLIIQDLSYMPRTEANPKEKLIASGKAVLMPDNKAVILENVRLYCEDNLIGMDTTKLDGTYDISFYTPSATGTYTYRVSIVESKDYIWGENTAQLTIKYVDLPVNLEDNIVNPNQPNRASGTVLLRSLENAEPVENAELVLAVYDSEGRVVRAASGWTDENGFYEISFQSPAEIGDYTVVVILKSKYRGIYSAASQADLFVKRVWLSLEFDDNIVMLTQDFTIFGTATLLPDNTPVTYNTVEIRRGGALYTTVQTDNNGGYSCLYTDDSPAPQRFSISVRTVDPEGIEGENLGYVEARELVFMNFVAYDSHLQFDSVLNPGENYFPSVQIFENNGIELIPVTLPSPPQDPLRMEFRGETLALVHVREGRWRMARLEPFQAPSDLGSYSYPVTVMGTTANGITGEKVDLLVIYVMKLELSVGLDDYIINPGDNFTVSGQARTSDGEPVVGQVVRIHFENQEYQVLTDNNGHYSKTLIAPAEIGDKEIRVEMTENRGLYQENRTTVSVKTIHLSFVPEGEVAPENLPFRFTGRAILLPENRPVPNTKVELFVRGEKVAENFTLSDGSYQLTYTYPKRGLYETTAKIVDENGIRAENSRTMVAGTPILIKGWLLTLDKYPIAGAKFIFYEEGQPVFEIVSDSQGYYYREVFAGVFDLVLELRNRENATVRVRFTRFDTTKLPPYSVLENLVKVDLPPAAFLAVPETKMTDTVIALELHQVFYENFENLSVTFDLLPYLQRYWIQDVTSLRVYRPENYHYENRSRAGEFINLKGKVDITAYTIEAWDNSWQTRFTPDVAYVLAEFDPLAATILQFQQAVETMNQAAQNLQQAASEATSAVENMKNVVTQLQEIIAGLATQENVRSLMELQQQMLALQENFLQIQSQLAQMQAMMLQMQENTSSAIKLLQSEIDAITEIINDIVYTIQQVQAGQADLAELINRVSGEVAGLGERISKLENYQGLMREDLQFVYNKLVEAYRMIEENLIPKESFEIRPIQIVLEIYQDKSADAVLEVTSQMFSTIRIRMDIVGEITRYLPGPYTSEYELGPREAKKFTFRFKVDLHEKLGVHTGEIVFTDLTGTTTKTVPVTIYVLPAARGMFDVVVTPAMDQAKPGTRVPVQVLLTNKGSMDSDVTVSLYLFFPTGENILIGEKTIKVPAGDARTADFVAEIPANALEGNYTFQAIAEYPINGEVLQVRGRTPIRVGEPTARVKVFGLSPWLFGALLAALIASGISGLYGYRFYRKRMLARKRFLVSIFPEELPKPGPTSIRIGHLAEVGGDAWLRLEDLRMHLISAGATGGGKTISSMVIVEEALMKGCNAIVFDPTAQWTGFLRKCTDSKMLSHYGRFGLKPSDARSFPGVVKLITNPRQKLDMKELIGEEAKGKITIFVIERLKPGDLDIFVTNVIQSIFASQPAEYPGLKTLLVFDECHRLLPKYGGTGAGVIQLERAVREFRKWGIGVMLISQTIADFSETIQTNCRTQIQFWTREEDELKRIQLKYGEEHVRSVSRASIGHAMVVNPDYNRGRPYYVNFRPILHSTFRLSPEELDKYYAADDRIENVKYKLRKLEEKGVDVFDLRIELGLAVRKLEEASFDLVNAYLDSLEPRVEDLCAKHGLKGIKRVIELVPEEDIRRAQLAAVRERERIARPSEIVEAYREILGRPVEVAEGAEKPLKEELHPEFAKMKEEEEKAAARAAARAKKAKGAGEKKAGVE